MVSFANGFVLFSVNLVNFQEKKRMQPTREREKERERYRKREKERGRKREKERGRKREKEKERETTSRHRTATHPHIMRPKLREILQNEQCVPISILIAAVFR